MNEKKAIAENFKGIIDSTLREGFQFSKANFSLEEQKKIFDYLNRIGVDYIEVGNPIKKEIQDMIVALSAYRDKKPAKILSHIRNSTRDVEKALESCVDGVNILCTADLERLAGMNLTLERYLTNLEQNVTLAKNNSLEVRVSVEDFFNQPLEASLAIYEKAAELRADRLGLADTLGKAMNWEVARRIKDLRRRLGVDFEVHFHNDLGHAVSNALTALKAGANWISTSLLGIGERTGITALSSFLVNIYVICPELTKRYNLGLLTQAENYISRICQIEMPINLMTNLDNGFAHKAGIHLDALIKFGPHKYESVPPRLVGNRRLLCVNTVLSGKTQASDVEEFTKKNKS